MNMSGILLSVSALVFWLLFAVWNRKSVVNCIVKALLLILAISDTIGALTAIGFVVAP